MEKRPFYPGQAEKVSGEAIGSPDEHLEWQDEQASGIATGPRQLADERPLRRYAASKRNAGRCQRLRSH